MAETIFGKSFQVICFAWDGTAVPDRAADAEPVRTPHRASGGAGRRRGGHQRHQRQGGRRSAARPARRGRATLPAAVARVGDVRGRPARPAAARPAAGDARRGPQTRRGDRDGAQRARRRGLEVAVISDRLNRRKIDLIPSWKQPPRARDRRAQRGRRRAVAEGRHRGRRRRSLRPPAGSPARPACRAPASPATPSTSRSASPTRPTPCAGWRSASCATAATSPSSLLVIGDEFGATGGAKGSDARMLVPELRGADVRQRRESSPAECRAACATWVAAPRGCSTCSTSRSNCT